MRVFQEYWFDLRERVLFKDTLDYTEAWLAREGITYRQMAFMMEFGGEKQPEDRLLAAFPGLARYHHGTSRNEYTLPYDTTPYVTYDYEVSSVPKDWPGIPDIHVPPEEWPLVRALIKKIPRPFNPSLVCFALDHVQWFPEINTEPALDGEPEELKDRRPDGLGLRPRYSNHISLYKEFDTGRKHNPVSVTIERTHSRDSLLDDAPIRERLTAAFGKPTSSCMHVIFNREEHRARQAADAALAPILEALYADLRPEQATPAHVPPAYLHHQQPGEDGQMIDFVRAAEGEPVSPKKAVCAAIKGTDLRYRYEAGGVYVCEKINAYNHRLAVYFTVAPMSRHMNRWIHITGYNFQVALPQPPGVDIMRQSTVDETVQLTLALALQAEELLRETLERLYGATPGWYVGGAGY